MKLIAMTDVETTGLDPKKHEIIEIGLIVFTSEPPFTIVDKLNIKVKPQHIETASPEALAVNGYKAEDWTEALPLDEAMDMYYKMARGAMFASHNVTFDWGFIGFPSKKLYDFDRHKIDTFNIAWAHLPHEKVKSWSLKNICKYLGIEPEPEIHQAINGATKAYEVYCKLMDKPIALF